jgi:cytochrome P450
VEELLRFDSPAQFIARVAREPLDIGGTPIAAGQAVLLMLASANRDPAQFDDPDRLDIRRENAGHLTFGRGKHSCLGGLLVRAQVGAALATLLSKTRGFDRSSGPIERIPRAGHRWVRRLDLELTPA